MVEVSIQINQLGEINNITKSFLNFMKEIALVLQGGGALGAYQLGAIKYFYKTYSNFQPGVITGVSIGAVNGAVLLGGKLGPTKSLEKLWDTVKIPTNPFLPQSWQAKASKMGNMNMYCINPQFLSMPIIADSVYHLTPFYKLLEELIDFEKLNNSPTKLIIQAVNVETGELKEFSNRDKEGLNLKKIIASISIPPNFPSVEIDGAHYWDGGLYANMPLSPAINYLESLADPRKESELIIISLFRKNSQLPTTISEVGERIKEIMFQSKMDLDHKFFEKMNDYIDLMQEIDREIPYNSHLRNNKTYQELIGHQKINRILNLQYQAEGIEGVDDFTPDQVDFRIREGMLHAKTAVTKANTEEKDRYEEELWGKNKKKFIPMYN